MSTTNNNGSIGPAFCSDKFARALLEVALEWCRARGLEFDAANENLPDLIEQYGGDCRKISADEYWDDKAVNVRA